MLHDDRYFILVLWFVHAGIATENTSGFGTSNKTESNVPSEDKYAALKDLDCQMKSQLMEKQQEEIKQKLCKKMYLYVRLPFREYADRK